MSRPVERPKQPTQEVHGGCESQENKPEPQESEKFLIEEIDGQSALQHVVVNSRLMPDFKLTQGDSWEAFRIPPVLTLHQALHNVNSVQVVVDLEEGVEQEELTYSVGNVEDLDHHVARDKVVAVQLASDQTTRLGDEVFNPDDATRSVLPLCQQVPIHLVDNISDCFLSDLEIRSLRTHSSRVHDSCHVDSRPAVQEPPEEARDETEEALEDEDEWNPLVVRDHGWFLLYLLAPVLVVRVMVVGRVYSLCFQIIARDDVVHGKVVCVADPAYGVGVVSVRVGELGRTPAGYWSAYELFGGDEEAEADEDDDGVLTS